MFAVHRLVGIGVRSRTTSTRPRIGFERDVQRSAAVLRIVGLAVIEIC